MAGAPPQDPHRWAPGTAYGPVLSQTDLYLLNPVLEIHPILRAAFPKFQLVFNLSTGQTGGFNMNDRNRDLPFEAAGQSATLPRVTDLYIIITQVKNIPWCTTVRNQRGVTMSDICQALWKDYTDSPLTDTEFLSFTPVMQERIKRVATHREAGGYNQFFQQALVPPNRCRRIDCLEGLIFFQLLKRDDDAAKKRLGFTAPNVFVLELSP